MKKLKHVVFYTENSSSKVKKFKDKKEMKQFIKEYKKQWSDPYDGYWIDYSVTYVGKLVNHYV